MGDITAALCTAWVLGIGLPYWWALLIPAIANVAWAFLTAQLVADPYTVGIITPEVRIRQAKHEAKRKEMAELGESVAADEGPQPITYLAALKIPMVAQYAVAFGFFKLTNYVLFFWLPYFLGKAFDPVTANLIAALYSVGMMPGGIIVGYVSDLFGGRRAVVIGVFMCMLIVFLGVFAVYSEAGLSPGALLVMLGCMGILVGGYVLLCSVAALSATLRKQTHLCQILHSRHLSLSSTFFSTTDQTILSLRPSLPTWPLILRCSVTTSLSEPSRD
jgi:sugar phosphate permease